MLATVIYPAILGENRKMEEPEKSFQVETDQTFVPEMLDNIWRKMNVVDDSPIELPKKLKCRSMMVGDIIQINDRYFIVDNIGFYEATKDYVSIWRHLDIRNRMMGPKFFQREINFR